MAFLLDVKTVADTVVDAQLKEVCKQDATEKARYQMKAKTTNLSRNRHLYDEEQIRYMGERLKEHNLFFGYADLEGVEENETAFFDYKHLKG